MEIKSERLKLTKLKQKDLDFLYKMASEPLVYLYDADEVPIKEHIYEKYINKISEMEVAPEKHFTFLINLLPGEVPIREVHINLNWEEIRQWKLNRVY